MGLPLREKLKEAAAYLRERGVDPAGIEAALLLSHVLGLPRERILIGDDLFPEDRAADLDAALSRRGDRREPFAYIAGSAGFGGIELEIAPCVLVPRPATECLAERALPLPAKTAADIGTGSGALAIFLAVRRPGLRVVATDVSREALDLAARNAANNGVAGRVEFREGSLLDPIDEPADLIVSNPPYVRRDVLRTLEPEIHHEPRLALDGGDDGLDFLRPLVSGARERLTPGGTLLVEFGFDQADAVRDLASAAGYSHISIHKDLDGIDRILEARP